MAEVLIPRRTINKQEYVLLADITVDTAKTSVDITGLNIGKEEEIVLVSDIYNTSSGATDGMISFNGNYTFTNYYVQRLIADSTTYSATRINENRFCEIGAGLRTISNNVIKLTNNGYATMQSSSIKNYNSTSIILQNFYLTSTFTISSITTLRVSSSTSNQFGIGSRFQLYRSAK